MSRSIAFLQTSVSYGGCMLERSKHLQVLLEKLIIYYSSKKKKKKKKNCITWKTKLHAPRNHICFTSYYKTRLENKLWNLNLNYFFSKLLQFFFFYLYAETYSLEVRFIIYYKVKLLKLKLNYYYYYKVKVKLLLLL